VLVPLADLSGISGAKELMGGKAALRLRRGRKGLRSFGVRHRYAGLCSIKQNRQEENCRAAAKLLGEEEERGGDARPNTADRSSLEKGKI